MVYMTDCIKGRFERSPHFKNECTWHKNHTLTIARERIGVVSIAKHQNKYLNKYTNSAYYAFTFIRKKTLYPAWSELGPPANN